MTRKDAAGAVNGGLEQALVDAGGAQAPEQRAAGLRALLLDELRHGRSELRLKRSGYSRPVLVAIGGRPGLLLAVAPVDAGLRADVDLVGERDWLVVAALVGALVEAAAAPAPTGSAGAAPRAARAGRGRLVAGELCGSLVLALPIADHREAPDELAALAALSFDERVAGIDRLRARAVAVPAAVLHQVNDFRDPVGAAHPLRVAEAIARLGGDPAADASAGELEEAVLELLGVQAAAVRPHQERDPSLRVARRIVQRLDGMGKWGGYHTDVSHLARGFAGHERALALEVGERLLDAELLLEKPSVGQRHVYLNPRRAREIRALIETGELPDGLSLPRA
jgi:hypothetical protein